MLPVFYIFFALTVVGFLAWCALKVPRVFIYIFLLGLPFDHFNIRYGQFAISISDAALILLMIAWIFKTLGKNRPELRFAPQVYFCLMIIILVTAATLVNSAPPESYFSSFSFSVKMVSFILLLQLITTEKEFIDALLLLLIGASLSVFLAIYQEYCFVTGNLAGLRDAIPTGAMAGMNSTIPLPILRVPAGMNRDAAYGVYLSFPLSIFAGIFLFHFREKLKLAAVIPMLLMLTALLLNDTRSAYVGIILTIFIALFLSNTGARYLLIAMSIAFPLIILLLFNLLLQKRPETFFQRLDIIIPILEYSFDHPLGGGIFDFARASESGLGAHSSFMQVLTHGGFFAFAVYSALLITIFTRLIAGFRRIKHVKRSGSFRYGIYALMTSAFFGTIIQSELIHPRAANKDHWVFLALFMLTPLIADAAEKEEPSFFADAHEKKEVKFANN